MEKIVIFLTACLMLTGIGVSAEEQVTVLYNGRELAFDVQPQVIEGRTLVPMRAIFEAAGAAVEWYPESGWAVGVKDATKVAVQVGNPVMTVNDRPVIMDAVAQMTQDRLLVPLRAVSEGFGFDVHWVEETNTVKLFDWPKYLYSGYATQVQNIIKEYGLFKSIGHCSGLIDARLIDFDRNGMDELLCIVKRENDSNFAYAAVYAVGEDGTAEEVFCQPVGGRFGQTDVSYAVRFQENYGRICLIVDDYSGTEGTGENISIFTMRGGVPVTDTYWAETKSMWDYETFDYNKSEFYTKCLVNGEVITPEKYIEDRNALIRDAKYLYLLTNAEEDERKEFISFDKVAATILFLQQQSGIGISE